MNQKFDKIRIAGALSYADDLMKVAYAMIDDCRFEHRGAGDRIGGEEEQDLLSIEKDIVALREKLKKFIMKY